MTDSQFAVAAGIVVAALCFFSGFAMANYIAPVECAVVIKDSFGNVHEMQGRC